MRWYENEDGSTKTHNRARTCEQCREHPRGGCALPFRKARKVRWLAALDKRPTFFSGLWLSQFMRSNAKVSGAGTASAGLPGYAGDNNGE